MTCVGNAVGNAVENAAKTAAAVATAIFAVANAVENTAKTAVAVAVLDRFGGKGILGIDDALKDVAKARERADQQRLNEEKGIDQGPDGEELLDDISVTTSCERWTLS